VVAILQRQFLDCEHAYDDIYSGLPPCGYAGLSATPPQPPAGYDPRGFLFGRESTLARALDSS
jgi:hypothetical protein